MCVAAQHPSNLAQNPPKPLHHLERSITIAWPKTAPHLDSPSSTYAYIYTPLRNPRFFSPLTLDPTPPAAAGQKPRAGRVRLAPRDESAAATCPGAGPQFAAARGPARPVRGPPGPLRRPPPPPVAAPEPGDARPLRPPWRHCRPPPGAPRPAAPSPRRRPRQGEELPAPATARRAASSSPSGPPPRSGYFLSGRRRRLQESRRDPPPSRAACPNPRSGSWGSFFSLSP